MEHVLCYGDSLTWGVIPGTRRRHAEQHQWPKVFAAAAEKFVTISALNGRTTAYDYPGRPYRNGLKSLPMILEQHAPLDRVIIMLGTNDLFALPDPKAECVLKGIKQLAQIVRTRQVEEGMPTPDLLLISPPVPRPTQSNSYPFSEVTTEIEKEANRLPALIGQFAQQNGFSFFDASQFQTAEEDGVHLSAETSIRLGQALAAAVT